MKNWAGNQTFGASQIVAPESLEELQGIVAKADKVKALGTAHSFNLSADTSGTLVSLKSFNQITSLNPETQTVRVGAGVTYGQLASFLNPLGWALENLASLPHITVAGSVATATHGSGRRNQNLSAAVRSLSFVRADGSIDRPEDFESQVVHIGALGVVYELEVKILPAFEIRQDVYQNLPWTALFDNFDAVTEAGYSVSLFTDWTSRSINQVWVKGSKEMPDELFGAPVSKVKLHPLAHVSPENCTDQCGVIGPWHERLPHFKMDFMPSAGAELQSEFFVHISDLQNALESLWKISEDIARVVQISEIRFVREDNLLLSPAKGRDIACIHFTWQPDIAAVEPVIRKVESALEHLNPAPHWGKLFSIPPDQLAVAYPGLTEFKSLAAKLDPNRKFINNFLANQVGL